MSGDCAESLPGMIANAALALEAVRCQSAEWHVAVGFARVAIGTCEKGLAEGGSICQAPARLESNLDFRSRGTALN